MTKTCHSIKIADRLISADQPPYVICELSANHNGSLDTALQMIDAAAATGCDAIKLQTYTADTITLKSDDEAFQITGGLWDGRTLYDLYEEAHTPWDWHKSLFERAARHGMTMFSSPFDTTAVDFLVDLNAPAFKIASFEVIDLPLIRYVASTGKPMIMSTGMADEEEIGEAVQAARDGGCQDLLLLHCVSGYPAPAEDYNLRTIADMEARFGVPVGLSDHTLDNTTAVASIALGAVAIEKHFTLDRNGGGPDDSFSLEPAEFTQLCKSAKTAWQAIGQVDYGRKSSEQGNIKFRRSLYFVKDMKADDIVTADAVRSVRPGYGLPPKYTDKIIGARVTQAIRRNTPVSWDLLKSDV
ncbi:pseudaminic acid synthase [Roseobacter sp. CCS2]|uniref:pseudaminic acid synthase n=1 Tax=Roseobacter sp. CCS2 TaxID=391593 RepID=UPI0000F40336|nr:pseudaminic acid synthase [Roseobacter sp. CCS2]EBA13973.1 neuB protein [Roseobacter sp. CCS2]